MVNATVSHEIRSPLNSIYCQSVIIKALIKRLADLLASNTNYEDMKVELADIRDKLFHSQSINQ